MSYSKYDTSCVTNTCHKIDSVIAHLRRLEDENEVELAIDYMESIRDANEKLRNHGCDLQKQIESLEKQIDKLQQELDNATF